MGRRTAGVWLTAGVVCLAMVQTASAAGELTDPCGPGIATVDESNELESELAWLDVCSVDVSGASGDGRLRAVRMVLHLDGDVETATATGGSYDARFRTEHCTVWQAYKFYPGLERDTRTTVEAYCDGRIEPCAWPASEVPYVYCGTEEELRLADTAAVSAAADGNSVTITFDPNKLPAGTMLSGLAHDLAPGGTLTNAWVQTELHTGVRGTMSTTIGPGGDFVWDPQPFPLGGQE